MPGGPTNFEHRPVMVGEVTAIFEAVPAGVVVDATVGGGGHASAILEAHSHITVLGLDRDDQALAAAATILSPFRGRVVLRRARFDTLPGIMEDEGLESVSGVLFDLGVSSAQLDQPERGFSYRRDAPLDMRMDRSSERTAADVVNGYDEARLAQILRDFGDERHASRIARAIVQARPLRSTAELVDVVRTAIPAPARRRGGHPAKRTFQALRIEVNAELEILAGTIDAAMAALCPSGRCVVISYHSGEDRIVKQRFRHAVTGGCTCPRNLPCGCGARPTVRLLGRGVTKPGAEEIAQNPRAKSARLRAVEKLGGELAA